MCSSQTDTVILVTPPNGNQIVQLTQMVTDLQIEVAKLKFSMNAHTLTFAAISNSIAVLESKVAHIYTYIPKCVQGAYVWMLKLLAALRTDTAKSLTPPHIEDLV